MAVVVVLVGAGWAWWLRYDAGPYIDVQGLRYADVSYDSGPSRGNRHETGPRLNTADALAVAEAINALSTHDHLSGPHSCPVDSEATDTVIFHADQITTAVIDRDGCSRVKVVRRGHRWTLDESYGTVRAAVSAAVTPAHR
ncbi:hypothetical protein [Nakamurella endophytica]|uniref:hypothetical protein n=1 Tax=Nakamurella endophytica TaxID=1748367 RepID=UPI00166A3A02|nr:hypothetical protein [Nakamurella endophytica]